MANIRRHVEGLLQETPETLEESQRNTANTHQHMNLTTWIKWINSLTTTHHQTPSRRFNPTKHKRRNNNSFTQSVPEIE